MYLKVEDRKHFGAVEAKAELSLEIQLQAERDAIDRKEKEVSLFLMTKCGLNYFRKFNLIRMEFMVQNQSI